MSHKNSLFRIIILVNIVTDCILCQKYQCKKESNATDVLVTDYFLIAAIIRKFPTNQNEMNKFCKQNPNIESKIQLFMDKCMDNLTKRLANLLFYSIKKTNANICRSRRRREDFVKSGRCSNVANKENRKCWAKWMKALNAIILIQDHKIKMPVTCCVTYTLKSCFTQSYESHPKVCQQKAMNVLESLFGSYVTDTMGLICGDFVEDNDKCDKMFDKIPDLKNKPIDNSPISILSGIFDSFPSEEV